MADLGNFIKIVSAGGGPYAVTADLPVVGDITITDTSSSETFVIPAPAVARMLEDTDGTTSVELSQTTAANGGDQILFTVDGTQVGSVEILAGGLTKWTLDGILDPIVYAGTPQTTAQRDALTPSAGYMVYNSTTSQYEYYNGSTWLAMSGTSPGGATDVAAGLVELATPAEVTAGTDTARAVTPAGLKVELDKKEDKVDATVFQAVGSENTLGINTDDDTLQKIAVKLNAYIAEGGIDPWEAGKVYTDADLFTFSTTNTTAVDVNGNKIVSGESYIGKYPGGATSGATLTNAEMLLIEVVSDAKQDEGLRGAPVADNATLTALPARDYERRKVTADGKEYVFDLGAVSGTLADDGATGFWQEQIASGLITTYIDSSAGATVETLAASTVAGNVRLFTTEDVTNSATLAVASGETLNGVVDATFLFSNYTAGTQFRADEVTGGWVVSVVGASTQTGLHYIEGRSVPVSQLFSAPEQLGSSGYSIEDPFDLRVGNTVVIKQSGRYEIHMSGYQTASSGLGGQYLGIRVDGVDVAFGAYGSSAVAYNEVQRSLELTAGQVISFIKGANSGSYYTAKYYVRQLPTTESVLAGMVTPTSLAKAVIPVGTDFSNVSANNAYQKIEFGAASYDTDNAWDSANNKYVFPRNGDYLIAFPISYTNNSASSNDSITIVARVNEVDTDVKLIHDISDQIGANGGLVATLSGLIPNAVAGQELTIEMFDADDVIITKAESVLSIIQQPTSTVVMPDALEITNPSETDTDAVLKPNGDGTATFETLKDFGQYSAYWEQDDMANGIAVDFSNIVDTHSIGDSGVSIAANTSFITLGVGYVYKLTAWFRTNASLDNDEEIRTRFSWQVITNNVGITGRLSGGNSATKGCLPAIAYIDATNFSTSVQLVKLTSGGNAPDYEGTFEIEKIPLKSV